MVIDLNENVKFAKDQEACTYNEVSIRSYHLFGGESTSHQMIIKGEAEKAYTT